MVNVVNDVCRLPTLLNISEERRLDVFSLEWIRIAASVFLFFLVFQSHLDFPVVDARSDLFDLKYFELEYFLFIVIKNLSDLTDLFQVMAVHVLVPVIDGLLSRLVLLLLVFDEWAEHYYEIHFVLPNHLPEFAYCFLSWSHRRDHRALGEVPDHSADVVGVDVCFDIFLLQHPVLIFRIFQLRWRQALRQDAQRSLVGIADLVRYSVWLVFWHAYGLRAGRNRLADALLLQM